MTIERFHILDKPVRFYKHDDGKGVIFNAHDINEVLGVSVSDIGYTDLAEVVNALLSIGEKFEAEYVIDHFHDCDFDSLRNYPVWIVDWNE